MTEKKSKDWIGKAEKKMEKKKKACPTCNGTEGLFSHKAKVAGKSTKGYAEEVKKRLKGKTTDAKEKKLLKEAVFALNAMKVSKK